MRWSLSTQTPEAKLHATVLRVLSCAAPTRSSSLIRSCSCHCLLVFVRRAYRKPKFDLSLCGDFIGMSLVFVLCVLACLCVSVCVCVHARRHLTIVRYSRTGAVESRSVWSYLTLALCTCHCLSVLYVRHFVHVTYALESLCSAHLDGSLGGASALDSSGDAVMRSKVAAGTLTRQ